jgi:hypothetical protein
MSFIKLTLDMALSDMLEPHAASHVLEYYCEALPLRVYAISVYCLLFVSL